MPNVAAVTSKITDETARPFENNTVLVSKVNRQFDGEFARSGGKIGYDLKVRLPNRFSVRSGATFSATDIADPTITISNNVQKGVDFTMSTADMTMSFDHVLERYAKPAALTLAAQADKEGFDLYKKISRLTGTPGTQPSSSNGASYMMQANTWITDQAAPEGDRHLILSTQHEISMIDAFKGLYNSQGAIGEQYMKGQFAQGILGYSSISRAQSVAVHTAGAYAGTLQVDGAQGAASGASYLTGTLAIKGGSNSITGFFKAGDVITIDGLYDTNPLTGVKRPYLKKFTINADADTDGSGKIAALSITPAIVYGGPYKTVSAQAANNASITVVSGAASSVSEQSLAFHSDALTFVMADLEMPTQGVVASARRRVGDFSFRTICYYDGDNDLYKFRIDGLWGWAALRQEWACRLAF